MIMGMTGLFLVVFLLEHLAGNLLIVVDEIYFLKYAEFMGSTLNVPIRIMEIGLFLGFGFHIVDGLSLALKNRAARPEKYVVNAGAKNSTWFSRNMPVTGIVILVFMVLHLASFFMEARFALDIGIGVDASEYVQQTDLMYDGDVLVAAGHPNLYKKVITHFGQWWYSVFYVLAMIFLAFHLNHGFQSAFQSMGWNHPKYTPAIKVAGRIYSILIPAGYAAIPIYVLFMQLSAN